MSNKPAKYVPVIFAAFMAAAGPALGVAAWIYKDMKNSVDVAQNTRPPQVK